MTTVSNDGQPTHFDGVTLSALFFAVAQRGEEVAPAVWCRIVCAVCEQLHVLHTEVDDARQSRNLVHGGLSMEFVLVACDGSVFLPRIPPEVASVGQASPEQLEGRAPTVQSDVFGAGLALYTLLTHHHPFLLESEEESAAALRACVIPAPSTLIEIPPALEGVLMRALAKDPRQRHADVRALRLDLEQALAGLGMAATASDVTTLVRKAIDTSDVWPDGDGPPGADELLAILQRPSLPSGGPREIETYFDDQVLVEGATLPRTVSWVGQLLDLGFTRLGVKVEVSLRTGERVPVLSFAAASRECFANIWFTNAGTPMLYFDTVFEGGEVVLTRAYGLPPFRTERVVLTAAADRTIPEVLEAHRAEVQSMKARGAVAPRQWGRAERIEATRAYFRNPETPK